MNRNVSRMLSTVAVIGSGVAQANLPLFAAPVALPHSPIEQVAALKAIGPSVPDVQVAKKAAGQKLITLNFNEAPIRTALETMFQAAGVGYSISSQVFGNVNLNVQSVPIDVALRAMLRSSEQPLSYEVIGNVYIVKPQPVSSTAPQAVPPSAPVSPGSSGSAAPNACAASAAANPTERHWFKVIVQHAKSEDVYSKLSEDQVEYPGVIPSDIRFVVLQADNSILVNATNDEFASLKAGIGALDVSAH
jgi:type II secretory pathway component GspD/PulD (secretin)